MMVKLQTSSATLETLLHRYRLRNVALTTEADGLLCEYGDCPRGRDRMGCRYAGDASCPTARTFWLAQCDGPAGVGCGLSLGAGTTPLRAMQRMDLVHRAREREVQ